mmetsp:Transcript_31413/g.56949  ORF Transcript_31413/g.56949 Transcript_31413/m.56949 type:complete len:519 (+) Transcript_31413:90-1646(+)
MEPAPLRTAPVVREKGCLRRPIHKHAAEPLGRQHSTGSSRSKNNLPAAQVIIFVNRTSGGGRAGEYLKALGDGTHKIRLSKTSGKFAQVRAFDLRDGESGRKSGFLLLKELSQEVENPVRVMVAGGDGTVMWAISEMETTGVNLEKVVVGHIPFGTGNDFSRSTGWGPAVGPGDLIGHRWQHLKRDLKQWIAADAVAFDVWEVEVTSGAGFAFVHGGHRCITEQDKVQHGLEELADGRWRMKKRMVNYFSLGQCCRAGLGFEKRRTSSRLGNNMRYGYEGLKKLFLQPAPMVSDVVNELSVSGSSSSLASLASTATPDDLFDDDVTRQPSDASDDSEGSLTTTSSAALRAPAATQQQGAEGVLSRSYSVNLDQGLPSAELLFLNVPSFAGGANPWAWSSCEGQFNEDLSCSQDVGDGRLEVVSYSSGLGAAIDAANGKLRTPGRGAGQRVASAEGPFRMSFKSPAKAKYTSTDGRVYLQVDGEFFVAHQPEEVNVRHWRTVKVARRDKDITQFGCFGL